MSDLDTNAPPAADGHEAGVSPLAALGAPLLHPVVFSLGVGALMGGIVALVMGLRRRAAGPVQHARVAFTQPTDPANFSQTRDAGKENIRDLSIDRTWDETDDSSDASFPASDPPSHY